MIESDLIHGAIEIEREIAPNVGEFETLIIRSRTYNSLGRLVEEDEAPVVPLTLYVPSRAILRPQAASWSRIHSLDETVDETVEVELPGVVGMGAVIINNQVGRLEDPEEMMRVINGSRALLNRSATFSLEADFSHVLKHLPEAFNHSLPLPVARDVGGREIRARIFEVNTGQGRLPWQLQG